MRAVLDTNVVVSGLIWGGKPFALLRIGAEGDLELATSPVLIAELAVVLARENFAGRLKESRRSMEEAVSFHARLAITVTPASVPRVVTDDPDDDHVVAAAVAAGADLIISGDRHLLALGGYQGIRIVTPAEALAIIAP